MRERVLTLFYIPKHAKIRDSVMLARAVLFAVVVLLSLAAMSMTAYACFSYNIVSGSNVIKTSNFEADVSVRVGDANGDAVEVVASDRLSHTAQLKAGNKYYITLQHAECSTAQTGFVVITADRCDGRYHTQQIGRDESGKTQTVTFWLCPTVDTQVSFFAHWGTSAYCGYPERDAKLYISDAETISLRIGATKPKLPSQTAPVTTNGTTTGSTTTATALSESSTEASATTSAATIGSTVTTAPVSTAAGAASTEAVITQATPTEESQSTATATTTPN